MEGELKRIKNFFSSRRDTYKLVKSALLIKVVSDKQQKVDYKIKYDLTKYSVRMSQRQKDVFYLEPNDASELLELSKVEFKCQNEESRKKWYLAISKAIKESELITRQNPIQTVNNEVVYGPGMTLTDITEFLMNEDKALQKKIIMSDSAFQDFKIQMNELKVLLKDKQVNHRVA